MTDMDAYVAVFRFHSLYCLAAGSTPDLFEDDYATKKEALLAARALQIERGRDPNFVLDLTNADPSELGEFLR